MYMYITNYLTLTLSWMGLIIKSLRVWVADFNVMWEDTDQTLTLAVKLFSNNISTCGSPMVLLNYNDNFCNSFILGGW